MQIRFLRNLQVKVANQVKQPNGSVINEYTLVGDFKAQFQELTDEISFSIYGANIVKMYRIASPKQELEKFLKTKVTNKEDNISKYYITYDEGLFKIVAVREGYIDIEYIDND